MPGGTSEFTSEFFDYSSKAWMANKIRRGAMIYYRCAGALKSGGQCQNVARYYQPNLERPYTCGIPHALSSKTSSKN